MPWIASRSLVWHGRPRRPRPIQHTLHLVRYTAEVIANRCQATVSGDAPKLFPVACLLFPSAGAFTPES
jgi:hypothetical protein